MAKASETTTSAEILYYLSGAFKNAVEGGFMAREHAQSLWKACLRVAGHELEEKK